MFGFQKVNYVLNSDKVLDVSGLMGGLINVCFVTISSFMFGQSISVILSKVVVVRTGCVELVCEFGVVRMFKRPIVVSANSVAPVRVNWVEIVRLMPRCVWKSVQIASLPPT